MSSILTKIWTALRGGVREIGDAIVDSNGVRIFEQEIADAEAAIVAAKHQLTDVMAHKIQADRKAESLAKEMATHEDFARKALAQENEALALEVAEKIAALEIEHAEQSGIAENLGKKVEILKDNIGNAEKIIAAHKRELAIVNTTESVQKATIQVVENVASKNSTLNSARASLDRIKQKQAFLEDKLTAGDLLAKETQAGTLASKLEKAGITTGKQDAAAVLARIRNATPSNN